MTRPSRDNDRDRASRACGLTDNPQGHVLDSADIHTRRVCCMTFWSTMLGPLWEQDVPADATEGRLIGEIVCPECDNIIARLFDRETGVSVYSWNRGSS